jgi:hypothetical protein
MPSIANDILLKSSHLEHLSQCLLNSNRTMNYKKSILIGKIDTNTFNEKY